jgi:hypothetical protein
MIKIGVCRAPSYFDMFYIETDADIKTVNSFYKNNACSISLLVEALKVAGFIVNTVNMDFLIEENYNEIEKVNSLKL